jgi:hypothetical protein
MDTLTVYDPPESPTRRLRPLLGRPVTVRTATGLVRGVLLSVVKTSAWLVADNADVVVRLDDIRWIAPNVEPRAERVEWVDRASGRASGSSGQGFEVDAGVGLGTVRS